MFDSKRIILDLRTLLSVYLNKTLNRLFDNDSPLATAIKDYSQQNTIQNQLAIAKEIRLLVRIANGEIPGDLADDIIMGEVEDAIQIVLQLMFSSPGNPHYYETPQQFWKTELGQVIRHCQLWLRGDDLITYTEAVQILYPDNDVQVARMRIKRMVERGELSAYVDPTENNPQHAARVSREEVNSRR